MDWSSFREEQTILRLYSNITHTLPHSLGLRTLTLNFQTYNPLFEKILDSPLTHVSEQHCIKFLESCFFKQEAEKLIACKIHPQTIAAGWRKSVKVAEEALKAAAIDHGNDEAKFKEDLMNIARTTLSSKILVHNRDHFAKLAVDAVLRLRVSCKMNWYLF